MKRLLKNKKGLLGLDNIITALSNFFQSVFQTMPKPLLGIMFLFLLAVAGWVFSLIFHVAGIYCNSANEPVKLDGFLSGVSLIGETPDPADLGKDVIEDVNNVQALTTLDCAIYIENGNITYADGTKETLINRYVYRDNGRCTDCVKLGEVREERTGLDITGKMCADNRVIRKENADLSVLGKLTCGNTFVGACQPPEHYLYDRIQNAYACADESCLSSTIGTKWNEKLASKGAKLLYPDTSTDINPNSEHAIRTSCEALQPKLSIYGINLFSFETWLILSLIILMFWGYQKISSN